MTNCFSSSLRFFVTEPEVTEPEDEATTDDADDEEDEEEFVDPEDDFFC